MKLKKKMMIITGIVIVVVVVILFSCGIYNYTMNKVNNNNILFKPASSTTYKTKSNILNLTNNIFIGEKGVYFNLNTEKPLRNKIIINDSNKIGTLRSYILSWYNDGNQVDGTSKNVKYVIPTKKESEELLSFNMSSKDQKMFLEKYGDGNIVISIIGGGFYQSNLDVVKPNILVNDNPAYGFALFENKIMASGVKKFYYGFVTGDGVIVSAHDLKQFGRNGKITVISTGQKIDFDGANKGQEACLV